MKPLATWLLCSLLITTWSFGQAAKRTLANKMCPVMTDEEAVPEFWVEYQGKRVNFCCKFCRVAFLKTPAKFTKLLPQFAATETPSDASAKSDDSGADSGKTTDGDGDHPHAASHGKPAGPSTPDSAEHDHERDHGGQPHGIQRLIRFAGKFHPVLIHFPIALLVMALICEIVLICTSKNAFGTAAKVCLPFGALGALGAALSALMAERFATYPGQLQEVLERHENLGIAVAVIAAIAAVLQVLANRKRGNRRLVWAWRLTLLLSVIVIGITAHHGGTLIYGFDHFKW